MEVAYRTSNLSIIGWYFNYNPQIYSQLFHLNCRINTIKDGSIDFTGSTVSISHNVIKHLDQDWFRCKEWSKIIIANNTFGNFRNMIIQSSPNFESCLFQHNSMTEASDDSFNDFSAQCQIKELLFYRSCSCTFHQWLRVLFPKTSDAKFASMKRESYCRVSETLMHCFNTSILNYEQYNKDICDSTSKNKQLDCHKKSLEKKKIAVTPFLHPSELNDEDGMFNYIFILLGLAAVSFVAICSTFTYCLITKKMSSCVRDENENHYTINEAPQTNLHSLPSDPPPSYQVSFSFISNYFILIFQGKPLKTFFKKWFKMQLINFSGQCQTTDIKELSRIW